MIAGALTGPELTLLRTRPQRTHLYLAIPEYSVVYTALVDGTPATNDNTVTVAFNGGAGVLTDIKRGMMLLVGTAAGTWDVGVARIRKDGELGDTSFSIGITSDIDFTDGQFLTVINDFSLWPVHPYIDPSTEIQYMDYDIPYTFQNTYGIPVPIIGTHAVLELTGATVTTTFDASESYTVLGGAGAITCAWTCAGAVVATPAALSTDITFNAAGTYLVKAVITADYGSIYQIDTPSYRYVIVWDAANPLNRSFTLDSCAGEYESGNWSYRITLRDNASDAAVNPPTTYPDIRDRTLCLLVAKDWYGSTEDSIGPLSFRENIVCVGWVDGDSIVRSNDRSSVSFEVQGPTFWLGVQEGFPTGVDDTNAAPTDWAHIQTLTPEKGLYHFLSQRTTALNVMDCYITSDDHRLATTYTPSGSLLEQLRAICQKINAKAVCDRYGRLFCEIDTQFITPASRTFPIVQTLADRDWRDEIRFDRKEVSAVGQVDLSGVYYSGDLTTSAAIFSLAPGHYPKHYGTKQKVERIALDDQAEANLQAGLWLGYLNNEWPAIDVPMSSNYRAVDIAPRMFVQMDLAEGDTPRELSFSVSKKLIPRRVEFQHDNGEALLLTDISFEAETFASEAVTGDPPLEPPDPPEPPGPPVPIVPPEPEDIDLVVVLTKGYLAYSTDVISNVAAGTPGNITWHDVTPADLTLKIRDFVLLPSGECWLAVQSTGGDIYEGLWYSSDITTAAFTRKLDTGTARTLNGRPGGDFSQYSICLVGNECYAWLVGADHPGGSAVYHFWHGTSSMTHESVNIPDAPKDNVNQGRTFCTLGLVANYANTGFAVGVNTISLPGGACYKWNGGTTGGTGNGSSEQFIVNSTFLYIADVMAPQTAVYSGVQVGCPLVEKDGYLFWTDTGYRLMKNGTVQALTNTSGGTTGVFSAAGAQPGGHSCGDTYATIFWCANTTAANNSIRNIAMTNNGGGTWYDIYGDWASSVAVWDGGQAGMVTLIKWKAVPVA